MYLPTARQSLTAAAFILALIFATAALAGCSYAPDNSDSYSEVDIKLNDGRTIHCLVRNESNSYNGFSCDWGNAK